MLGCMRTRVRKQPIIALYFEFENVLKIYNLKTWNQYKQVPHLTGNNIWESDKTHTSQKVSPFQE